ncbi:MAG TPA: Tellurium resistance protein TerA [Rhodospirillaceae bacterium]|nr:Tellurium resistance protein TerA [Rhodospirillaceae bacterium]
MAPNEKSSVNSMIEASRYRAKFSGHHGALGAAGYRNKGDNDYGRTCEFLDDIGESLAVSPGPGGFESILIGVTWDNAKLKKAGFIGKMIGKAKNAGVDLDIGCLYELADGTRGAIQAFGEKFGNLDALPYIALSEDERTGNTEGHDEYILIKGANWDKIKRILVYIYIYDGAARWSQIRPQIVIDIPGESDLVVTLGAHDDALCLCAVGEVENVRGGIRLTNRSEYFPGHEEMDRAFGFGLKWDDGKK